MQLTRFNIFLEEIAKDKNLSDMSESISVYRHFDNKWYKENKEELDNNFTTKRLSRILEGNNHWRATNDPISYFPVNEFKAVIAAKFEKNTLKKTRDKFQEYINLCSERAQKSFDATHDHLTGLLNVQSLNSIFKGLIEELKNSDDDKDQSESSESAGVRTKKYFCIAMDIDHFKQVNDNYGHVYGDIVLKCLARRIEKFINSYKEEYKDFDDIYFSRPGGEEFIVFGLGNFEKTSCIKLAEALREEIGSRELPSENDISELNQKQSDVEIKPLPPILERRITVSIGFVIGSGTKNIAVSDPVRTIREKADKALYCAKNGGRNTVRDFDEILHSYGKIIEHNYDVDTVVIDIGGEVGVLKGQEFLVFHPQYTGNSRYMIDDGRTIRSLGMCPKIPLGTIIATDVQPEISFCKISENRKKHTFKEGYEIEAVPLGSITHLFEHDQFFHDEDITSKQKILEESENNKIEIASYVFFILNEVDLKQKLGLSEINRCLAILYEELKKQISDTGYIAKNSETEFCCLIKGRNNILIFNKQIKEIINNVKSAMNNKAEIAIGSYKSFFTEEQGLNISIDNKWALDFSNYSAVYAKYIKSNYVDFSFDVARGLIYQYRNAGEYHRAIKDYYDMKERGIFSSAIENQISLVCWDMQDPDIDLMINSAKRAAEISPEISTYWANLGLFETQYGDKLEGARYFLKTIQIEPSYTFPSPYLKPLVISLIELYEADNEKVSKEFINQYIDKALELSATENRTADIFYFNRKKQELGLN